MRQKKFEDKSAELERNERDLKRIRTELKKNAADKVALRDKMKKSSFANLKR